MHVRWLQVEGINRARIRPQLLAIDLVEPEGEGFHLQAEVIYLQGEGADLHQAEIELPRILLEAVDRFREDLGTSCPHFDEHLWKASLYLVCPFQLVLENLEKLLLQDLEELLLHGL